MLDSFLRSVTKDSYGPISFASGHVKHPVVVHRFHDAFSMLHFGKMPDALYDRGKANAFVFAHLNQLLLSSSTWKVFLRSTDALNFRKAGSSIPQVSTSSSHISSMLNDIAEAGPMRTNFLGVVSDDTFKKLQVNDSLHAEQFYQGEFNFQSQVYPVCEYYPEEKVPTSTVMGKTVWDYSYWKRQLAPKMLPFEVHCTFTQDFPTMELVLSQHPYQQKISASDALWITEWKPEKLQELYLRAAWIAAFARTQTKIKFETIPLRFGIDGSGAFVLVDSLALEDFVPIKELENFYKTTPWSEGLLSAQKHAQQGGYAEWKRFFSEPAPWLDPKLKETNEKQFVETARQILGSACS